MKIGICSRQSEKKALLIQHCHHLGYQDTYAYSSGKELLNSPSLTSLTLLFLEIEMPDLNGIDIKKRLDQISPTTFIVYYASNQKFMPEAFGRNVIFFLVTPLTENSIKKCIEQAAYFSKDFHTIAVNKNVTLPCREILYLQSEQKYTVIYTEDNATYLTKKTLLKWKSELCGLGFCAISRSAIINLKYYNKLIEKDRKVLMQNGVTIPVSRRSISLLQEQLNIFLLHRIRLEC